MTEQHDDDLAAAVVSLQVDFLHSTWEHRRQLINEGLQTLRRVLDAGVHLSDNDFVDIAQSVFGETIQQLVQHKKYVRISIRDTEAMQQFRFDDRDPPF